MVSESHTHGHRQRLRERFIQSGLNGFSDYEIVELMLTLAIPRSDVKQPAKQLIQHFGDLRGILDAKPEEISKIKGIGTVTPIALSIIKQLATLYLGQKGKDNAPALKSQDIENYWRMEIGNSDIEQFGVTYLDSALKLLGDHKIHWHGTIDRAAVYPREIMAEALKRKASAIVLAHNHPNGIMQPSEEDKIITEQIVLAAETLDIKVFDHFIVSKKSAFSFHNNMLL